MGHYDEQRENALEKHYVEKHVDTDSFMEPEFLDFLKVLEYGAKKYARNNWLLADGNRSSHKEMHDSMFHHLAESFNHCRKDAETGLDPLLHLASRALMYYVRTQRNIKHSKDL